MKFYLKVQPYVDKILIFQNNEYLRFYNEMIPVELENNEFKIFNGEVEPGKYYFRILCFENKTTYIFNDLFSIPFPECISNENNTIIVNTPDKITYVLIETPKEFQEKLNLNKYIFLNKSDQDQFKLTNMEKLKRGIDPQATSFIGKIKTKFQVNSDELEMEKNDFNNIINTIPFKINCYILNTLKEIEIKHECD